MHNRVKREERNLKDIFGEPYEHYCREINRFVPRFSVRDKQALLFFRLSLLTRNNEHLNVLGLIAFYILFYTIAR